MNRFQTGQGLCRANLHKWGLARSPSCDCGQRQTMNHIVDACPLNKFEGGLNLLYIAIEQQMTLWDFFELTFVTTLVLMFFLGLLDVHV